VILWIDPCCGPPHGYFTNYVGDQLAARRRPNRLPVVLTGLTSNVIGKVDHQSGPLGKILTPNGMIMKRFRDAGKPG
jgi:hypothetical protein